MLFTKKRGPPSREQKIIEARESAYSKILHSKDDLALLSSTTTEFFSSIFEIKKSLALEEMKQEISKKSMPVGLKERITRYLSELSHLQYSGQEDSPANVRKLKLLFHQIAEDLTYTLVSRMKSIHDTEKGGSTFNLPSLGGFASRGKADPFEKSSTATEGILSMVAKTRSLIATGLISEAKELYGKIMGEYSKLQSSSKKEMYFHISKLYEKFPKKKKN